MCETERTLGIKTFFMMDENFLLYKKRAMELLDLMKQHGKAWSMFVFSSANAIQKYEMLATPLNSACRGCGWDLNPPGQATPSSGSSDTMALTRELQSHGIRVQGSTIIGLEHHTPNNIRDEIDYAVAHDADCHQFMLYTPVPGIPLHSEMQAQGRMLEWVDLADIHGQFKFNFKHEHIERDDSKLWLDWAFQHDYDTSTGPAFSG